MVDAAVDFVMSKLDRWRGTREHGSAAPVKFGLPKQAVTEAILNAVAHRDYDSKASVQVMLFSDRLEVWNPGELPPSLISDPLFLAHYIERAGTGTLDMISLCREADLPEPEFRQDGGQFVMTLWRDWLTEARLDELGLNERQRKAVIELKRVKRISNADYQKLTGATKKTASRDLERLTRKHVLRKIGRTGRGTYYTLASNGDKKGTKGTLPPTPKGAKNGTNRT
jgi:ATP-dependent DNA helicase RecG